jgi:hypothetical protein
MFAGKAGAYMNEVPSGLIFTSKARYLTLKWLANIRLVCQRKTHQLTAVVTDAKRFIADAVGG